MRTTITIGDDVAEQAHEFGVNLSAAARKGITEAVRRARAEADWQAYERCPETEDDATKPWSWTASASQRLISSRPGVVHWSGRCTT